MIIRKMNPEEEQSFRAVRARLINGLGAKSKSYYAQAAFEVKPVIAEGLDTWAVDNGWRLYIGEKCLPKGEMGWNVEQCTEVFEHELNHLLRAHGERMDLFAGKNRDADKANIATDLEINDDLDPEGFVVSLGVSPSKLGLPDNKTAEWYYDNLPKNDSEEKEDDGESQGEGEGEGDSDADSDGKGNGKGSEPKLGKCGSGAGGKPIEGELDSEDDSIAKSKSEGEAKITRRAVAEAVKNHESQHGRGTIAGGLSEWADIELAPPTVSWQRVLGAAVRRGVRISSGNTDHTYSRMSRRASNYRGFAMPAMISQKPRICAVVDTSGSMSVEMIHAALNEVQGIAKAMGCTGDYLTLIQVDSAVGSVKPFADIRKIEITGRGGTDMRIGIEAAQKMPLPPNTIVLLTDGETPYPAEKLRGASLIVGIIGDEYRRARNVENAEQEVPWATVVEIGNKGN